MHFVTQVLRLKIEPFLEIYEKFCKIAVITANYIEMGLKSKEI